MAPTVSHIAEVDASKLDSLSPSQRSTAHSQWLNILSARLSALQSAHNTVARSSTEDSSSDDRLPVFGPGTRALPGSSKYELPTESDILWLLVTLGLLPPPR
ncbi:hypothetical protein L198_08021 [Cryptococcus wingfieldii CBS 7118]|uniref:Uncharacterized protein n=1 Tax=Cryptococcus wingfieldii CBS 7118 TaxID=1295528 RepID=A0A1E3HP53_9TREE|nr:hypothetical protein L198_08021 [Cryptococcus wingfieldii CBS 7118]ODN78102.1 hypothetical protein L198_08021 [Cryptococcus wingfieldii CBS 7118]